MKANENTQYISPPLPSPLPMSHLHVTADGWLHTQELISNSRSPGQVWLYWDPEERRVIVNVLQSSDGVYIISDWQHEQTSRKRERNNFRVITYISPNYRHDNSEGKTSSMLFYKYNNLINEKTIPKKISPAILSTRFILPPLEQSVVYLIDADVT